MTKLGWKSGVIARRYNFAADQPSLKATARHGRLPPQKSDSQHSTLNPQLLLRQAPSTTPLIAKATNDRPMSIKMSGQGFVSKAENTAMVACSTNRKPNQQTSAIFNPATAVAALRREISQANV